MTLFASSHLYLNIKMPFGMFLKAFAHGPMKYVYKYTLYTELGTSCLTSATNAMMFFISDVFFQRENNYARDLAQYQEHFTQS